MQFIDNLEELIAIIQGWIIPCFQLTGFRILRQVGRVRLKDRHMQVDDYGSVTKLELEVYKLDLTIRVY